jgi:hypothetical protein
MFAALSRRYGSAVTLNLPVFGQTVVISDPALVRNLFSTSGELVERPTILGEFFGPGSTFSLTGEQLVERRRVVFPPFHGKRVGSYEEIVEQEVLREIATWPQGREFRTLEPMQRITLGAILRAVFGAEGPALDRLRVLLPPALALGGRLMLLPRIAQHDLGRWSPGRRFSDYRRQIDAVIDSLIAEARADRALGKRGDMLALLLQARDTNGEPIPDKHIADELLTMVTAGHETTASELSWAVERLCRHPRLLARLADEIDAGGSELRHATISEVQRTRPVIDGLARRTKARIRLGEWVILEDTVLIFSIRLAHLSEQSFADASSFKPDRFLGAGPKPLAFIPFGGGVNRCIGAAFANMEMDVTLRVLLRDLHFAPTDAPSERRHSRGVVTAPARGGRAVVRRRTGAAHNIAGCGSAAHHRARSASNP